MVQRSALPLSTGKNYKVVTLCGSTEIAYAEKTGKKINYLEKQDE